MKSKSCFLGLLVVLILAILSPLPRQAFATDIRIDVLATVSGITDVFCQCIPPDSIMVGDTLAVHYYFESGTPDTDPDPDLGEYEHSTTPYGVVVSHKNYLWGSNPASVSFSVRVENDVPFGGGNEDRYWIVSDSNLPDDFTHEPLQLIAMFLVDESSSALSDDALPTAVNLSDWPTLRTIELSGAGWWIGADVISVTTQPTGVQRAPAPVALRNIYPNPFSSATTATFTLENPSLVTIGIYDVRGRLVRLLAQDEYRGAGEHSAVWDGHNSAGQPASAGIYFLSFMAGPGPRETRSVLLIR
jgi:hypothetical protein